jgi:hypothetical protein
MAVHLGGNEAEIQSYKMCQMTYLNWLSSESHHGNSTSSEPMLPISAYFAQLTVFEE